jgi:D-alanine-D-alanine ligase
VHNLCNDKYLSKLYAREFGISSAKSVLIRNFDSEHIIDRINTLKLPIIAKPNFGGGSTGISTNSIVNTYLGAANLVQELFHFHQMPILVEEYIEGYEIELVIWGNKGEIKLSQEVKLIMNKEDYFKNKIWGYETKKIDDSCIDFEIVHMLSKDDIENMFSLFRSFDKIEFMRVDGRIFNGHFYLIELSPDCYLGDDCAFYSAFNHNGYKHEEMFNLLIENSLTPD